MEVILNKEECRSFLEKLLDPWKELILVTGFHSFENHPYKEIILSHNFILHFKATGNPIRRDINISNINSEHVLILAVGGGCVIDTAKLFKHQLQASINTTLVVMPTTAGSGSESTQFAVEYREGIKYSISQPYLLPDYVGLTPECIQNIINPSVIDSFCQALESLWSRDKNLDSTKYSRLSLELLNNALRKLESKEGDLRLELSLASNFAGKAINISRTNICHALSYYLTANHKIPHGVAVFISLKFFFKERVTVVRECLDQITFENLTNSIALIEKHILTNKVTYNLLSLHHLNMGKFLTSVNEERLKNYPYNIDFKKYTNWLNKFIQTLE